MFSVMSRNVSPRRMSVQRSASGIVTLTASAVTSTPSSPVVRPVARPVARPGPVVVHVAAHADIVPARPG